MRANMTKNAPMPQDTLQDLNAKLLAFARERDWEQFHSPKNLSMALAGEAGELASRLVQAQTASADLVVLGPIEAPLARIKDRFRWQLLLKGRPSTALHRVANGVVKALAQSGLDRRASIRVDVDPYKMM